MVSTVQQIKGLEVALSRLESRIKRYREVLSDQIFGRGGDSKMEDVAPTKAEVTSIESLIVALATRIEGHPPVPAVWEPMHDYCSREEEKHAHWSWAEQNHEYFRCSLLWLQGTRGFLAYLSGLDSAVGQPAQERATAGDGATSERPSITNYDVALSFAGEDRRYARELAELLTSANFGVFYDEYEQSTLWGRNLYTHLSDIYQNKARFCVMFISQHYAKKLWTKRERESAQARAFRESEEYILPLRLDDTVLPGLEDTVGYIDLRHDSVHHVFELLSKKLQVQR
jgi:hypothetical protein